MGLSNSKRIVKNSGMLYIRLLLTMVITLYTSRIMLNVLGFEDFGIYNLVAGIIVLFSFIQTSMTTAVQRFLNFALGKRDLEGVNRVFNTSIFVYVGICIIVFLFAETIGLWFVGTQLNIPTERSNAATWVYQFSVLTTLVQILQLPYNASIIAHEKMSFYAIFSLVESLLKLLIVYILLTAPDLDKLKLYSVLVFIVSIISFLSYRLFCVKNIPTTRFKIEFDKDLFYKILNFSSWSMFGSLGAVGLNQGIGVVMNIFYGIITNAALGITNQVSAAVNRFVGSFQTAFNPQIVKSYAQNDFDYLKIFVLKASKYSYFLMLLFVIPLLVNIEYILEIWLTKIPPYAISFCRLTLIYCLIDSLAGSFYMVIYGSGKIRNYQIVITLLMVVNILIAYILLSLGFDPSVAILIRILVSFISVIYRVFIVDRLIGLAIRSFFSEVLLPILLITTLSLLSCFFIKSKIELGLRQLLIVTVASIIITLFFILIFGLDKSEKKMVWNNILKLKTYFNK